MNEGYFVTSEHLREIIKNNEIEHNLFKNKTAFLELENNDFKGAFEQIKKLFELQEQKIQRLEEQYNMSFKKIMETK